MNHRNYQRTVSELESLASMFWPYELSEEAAKLSVIPKLLETQDEFIAILGVPVPDMYSLFKVITASSFSANLFLKHLIILADFWGEQLQRVNSNFSMLFPDNRIEYYWNGNLHSYKFQELPVSNLTNTKLGVSSKKLLKKRKLDALLQDVAAILLFGGASTNSSTSEILSKCEVGEYVGQPDKLAQFIKQRYIWVSRITMGSRSNNLGQLAQQFVLRYIENNVGIADIQVKSNGTIPGITHTDAQTNRPTTFDVVVSKGGKYVAIEVSFQVTTNSVIERKAGQAQSRFNQIENAGYKIAYVLDGAGNFQRETALGTICSYSHCTVAFSKSELNVLCEFIRGHIK